MLLTLETLDDEKAMFSNPMNETTETHNHPLFGDGETKRRYPYLFMSREDWHLGGCPVHVEVTYVPVSVNDL